jgi:regulator of replication initiation timing
MSDDPEKIADVSLHQRASLMEENRILRIGNAMLRDTVEMLCQELEAKATFDTNLVAMARRVLGYEKIAPHLSNEELYRRAYPNGLDDVNG